MKITCYFIGWQIQETIAFTIKHYQKFCQRVVYFDNHSSDLSRDIALQLGADVRLFGTPGVLDDQAYLDLKKSCWKMDDSDLVIVCDDDEILLHPPKEPGTIFKTQGYGMYSKGMPATDWLDIKTGLPDDQYSKYVIFDPKAIQDIGYVYGCHGHQTRPQGNLKWGQQIIPLLHYRGAGGTERIIRRHREYNQKKRGEANIRWNLAAHYQQEETEKRTYFDEQQRKSETLPFLTGI